jgi:hypothetical protein
VDNLGVLDVFQYVVADELILRDLGRVHNVEHASVKLALFGSQ